MVKFISINSLNCRLFYSETFPLLANVSHVFEYLKELSSMLCYLSVACTAKSLHRVFGVEKSSTESS